MATQKKAVKKAAAKSKAVKTRIVKPTPPAAEAVPVQNTPENKLAEISVDLSGLEKKAAKITIASQDDVTKATEFLTGIKARQKRIEEIRKFFVDPLNQQVKKINALFKVPAEKYGAMETLVKRAMSDYAMKVETKRREEEAKLQAEAKKQEEAASKKGEQTEFAMTPTVERQDQTVRTQGGSATNKFVWKFEITSINQLVSACLENPELIKFLQVNETAVRKSVDAGERNIPGVRIYEDVDVAVRTS